jgi:hypothetical protein
LAAGALDWCCSNGIEALVAPLLFVWFGSAHFAAVVNLFVVGVWKTARSLLKVIDLIGECQHLLPADSIWLTVKWHAVNSAECQQSKQLFSAYILVPVHINSTPSLRISMFVPLICAQLSHVAQQPLAAPTALLSF